VGKAREVEKTLKSGEAVSGAREPETRLGAEMWDRNVGRDAGLEIRWQLEGCRHRTFTCETARGNTLQLVREVPEPSAQWVRCEAWVRCPWNQTPVVLGWMMSKERCRRVVQLKACLGIRDTVSAEYRSLG
jgi:hypothetical protein